MKRAISIVLTAVLALGILSTITFISAGQPKISEIRVDGLTIPPIVGKTVGECTQNASVPANCGWGCCTSKQIACSSLFLFAVFEFDLENYLSVCGNQRYL